MCKRLFFHLKVLLYITIFSSININNTIIFPIISVITIVIIKYIIQQFSYCATYVLTLSWFQIWFPFVIVFFLNSLSSIFWFLKPHCVLFFPPITLRLLLITLTTGGVFKSMNSSGIVYLTFQLRLVRRFWQAYFCFVPFQWNPSVMSFASYR